jgi:crotonobetainyl-CoA:carnitine CoA-transferase CaiB-like acyl-CoA transferase
MTGRAPRSAHPSLVPSQLYQTEDGWIFIMCNKEKFWPILAEKMGHPEWSARPEFKTFKDRLTNKSQFNEMLEIEFLKDTTNNWMKKFEGIVPAAPVYDVAQALDNPFVHSRQGVINAISPDGLSVAGVAAPIRCPGESVPANAAPGLGEHTQALLKQAGLSDQQIAFLREHAVI